MSDERKPPPPHAPSDASPASAAKLSAEEKASAEKASAEEKPSAGAAATTSTGGAGSYAAAPAAGGTSAGGVAAQSALDASKPPSPTMAPPSTDGGHAGANEASPPAAITAKPPAPLADADAFALIHERFALERDPRDRWGLTVICPAGELRALINFLRHEPRFAIDMLLDIVGVDYLAYPNHREARFAAIYAFKSLRTNQRVKVKVWLDEEHPHVPSIHDLFRIADWLERETWDQFGIVFDGHPNPKRLLNHHEFVGHPLRKDYPCQKRQKLSVNDPLVDQLTLRLRALGYTVLDPGAIDSRERFATRPAALDGVGDRGMNDPDLAGTANGRPADAKWGVL